MTTYFADTFFYLALINPRDASHEVVSRFARTDAIRVVTTQFVLLEIGDSLAGSGGRRAFQPLIETLTKDRRTRVVRLSQGLLEEGVELYTSRPDKGWSLTDCTSFAVMRRMRLRMALTGDRHFEQAGFEVVFRNKR